MIARKLVSTFIWKFNLKCWFKSIEVKKVNSKWEFTLGKQRKRMSETSSKWKKEKLIFSGEKSLKYVDINPLEVSESRSPSDLVRNFGSLEDSKAKIVENW